MSIRLGGGGGFEKERLHDYVNDHIVPAVYKGITVISGNCAEKDGRLVIGRGVTVLKVTLENSRNTPYDIEFYGVDAGLVTESAFEGTSAVLVTLDCPDYEQDKNLDIVLRLVAPPGYASSGDCRLPLVYILGKIQFLHIIANPPSGPVTTLALIFEKSVPGLLAGDIAVTVDGTGPFTPHSLAWLSEGICEIGIDAPTPHESITVEVAPPDTGASPIP
jgi:hypothetical protein